MTKTGWIIASIFIAFFLLVFIVYLRGSYRRRIRYKIHRVPRVEESHFTLAMRSISISMLTQGTPVGFWSKIDEIYAARNKAMREAKRTIHFESFYTTPGKRADEFAKIVSQKAQEGVEVQVLVDSFGALLMPKKYWQKLEKLGVQVRFYHKLNWRDPLSYDIRSHRKILSIDGEIVFVGGMGLSDFWDGSPSHTGSSAPWLDVEVAFRGPIVATLEAVFMQHWIEEGGSVTLIPELFSSHSDSSSESTILVTPTSPPGESSPISRLFFGNILAAKKRIWIASPYFLCDVNSHDALLQAKDRGVDVRVLTVGPYYDHKYVYFAARELYGEWLSAGIKIYEYLPNMMHAKMLLVDDQWVSTGSTNFDPRSFFHNAELNISWCDSQFAQRVERFFLEAFEESNCITVKEWQSRSYWQRLQGQMALFVRWQL